MPAYNSKLKDSITERYGNVAVLPIKGSKGPAPAMAESATEMDIVDEALFYFRANVLFRSFEVKNDADRILVYVTLFTAKLLETIVAEGCKTKDDARRTVRSLASESTIKLPGESGFPLSSIMQCDASKRDAMRAYFKQLRMVTAERLFARIVEEDGSLNKWWLSFHKSKFMNKSL